MFVGFEVVFETVVKREKFVPSRKIFLVGLGVSLVIAFIPFVSPFGVSGLRRL